MKKLDLILPICLFLIYILVSPFIFGYLYPEPITGDGGLAYVFVLAIAIIASLISVILFIILDKYIVPEKTYKIKWIIPLILSSVLMYCSGGRPHYEFEQTFLIGNSILLFALYISYVIAFYQIVIVRNNHKTKVR